MNRKMVYDDMIHKPVQELLLSVTVLVVKEEGLKYVETIYTPAPQYSSG